MKEVLKYSQRTGHIHFFNQLFQGNDIAGILGEFITAVINTTSATFEIGPVTSLYLFLFYYYFHYHNYYYYYYYYYYKMLLLILLNYN